MTVRKLDSVPRRPWWQRLLRRAVGARDLVAVVATERLPDGHVVTNTFWLDGVDVTMPIATDVAGTTVVIQPLGVEV